MKSKNKILLTLSTILMIILCLSTYQVKATDENSSEYIYLSDYDWVSAQNGYTGGVRKNEGQNGKYKLSLTVDDTIREYKKGFSIHANGYVIYDISALSTEYTHFVAQVGVDNAKESQGSINCIIYVSNDNKTWTSKLETGVLRGGNNAYNINLDITGYKYIKIYIDKTEDGNANDHGTIGEAKLVRKDIDPTRGHYDKLQPVEYYDNILKNNSVEYNYNNNYKLVLKRELVKKLGYWNIQDITEENEKVITMLDWLIASDIRLEQAIEVGNLSDQANFLNVLADLYTNSPSDFEETEGNGLVYTKMIIALAATYSSDAVLTPLSFNESAANYNYIARYTVVKKLYDENKFMRIVNNTTTGNFIEQDWFKTYHIELIRMIMHEGINENEFIWLNEYSHRKNSLSEYNVPYIDPNYSQTFLYAEENREKYNKAYYLDEFNIPYGDNVQRYWMVMAAGNICWGQSRFAQTMYRTNGIPAIGAYTPEHEPYITYYQDDNGNGYWTTRYGSWTNLGTTWYEVNRNRLIFDWANKSFTDQNINESKGASSGAYIYLAQANLNNYEKYKKSLYYNLIANSYDDNNKKIETHFKALEVNNLNLDSYDSLLNLYKQMDVKKGGTITADDWYDLAIHVINSYEHFPVAMYDILKVIRPYLENESRVVIDALEKEKITAATKITAETANSVGAVNMQDAIKLHANQLLDKTQADPVTFSFDGENAGKIVLNPNYRIAFRFSLDGGKTFSEFETVEQYIQLTKEEVSKITVENNIIIDFMGLSNYRFTINITQGQLDGNLYFNDWENRVIGIDNTYEWRNSENEDWKSFADETPNNTGDKTLYVRRKARGTQLPSISQTFQFTKDANTDTRKYIPIEHLSVEAYSSQSQDTNRPFYAPNAIDGNINTLWHVHFSDDYRGKKAYFTIKLDDKKYLSALEFVQTKYQQNDPDYIKNMIVYISDDNENWTEIGRRENCIQNQEFKAIEFKESMSGQYVKLEMETYSRFASLAMVNLFEDFSKSSPAKIEYSTKELTNQNVVVTLVSEDTDIIITNNNGSNKYTFTENGSFTFEFVDNNGKQGIATANVDWIDKNVPFPTIAYNITEKTNQNVTATVMFDKENVTVEGGNTHTFTENGKYVFNFTDEAGNTGTAEAIVSWIDKTIPIAAITYSPKDLTNQNVIATITFDKENVTVKGGNTHTFTENGEYIFEFEDEVGNKGTAIARVYWIDKVAPTATVIYDIRETTNQNVTATLTDESEEITITNNNGSNTYTFAQNESFTFEFIDKAGNKGSVTATVDWIIIKNPSFEITLIAPSEKLNPGDEFEIDVIIDNLQDIDEGLIALIGQLEYDEEDLELLEITGENGWNIDKNSFNGDNFKFITENGKHITENGSLIKLKLKVKESVSESKDTILKVKSVVASDGKVNISAEEKQVTLTLEKTSVEITSEDYKIEEKFISRILPLTKVSELKRKITTNKEVKVVDENGNVLSNDDIIKTGMKLKVGKDELELITIIIGDINKDGELSVTDLALTKLHLIEEEPLTGVSLKAADMNGDGSVEITDLAQIKLILIGLMELR